MHVILNVDALQPPITGVGVYTRHLAEGLPRHPRVESVTRFTRKGLLSGNAGAAAHRKLPEPLRRFLRRIPFARELRQWVMALALGRLRRERSDPVYHEPNYLLMPYEGRCVVTVHDLSHIHYPQFHPPERVEEMNRALPESLARANRIITDSEFVRRELIELLGVPAEKVDTVPIGVDAAFHPRDAGDLRDVLRRHGLEGVAYLLAVATLEPRKNLVSLCAAYERLAPELKPAHPIVLAGSKGWRTEEIDRAVARLSEQGHLRWLGYVAEEELPALYAGARAFAFPSIYEGFGLPVLEAMASGIPVLSSNRSSIPEIAGDAALLVDPEDVAAIAAGLERVLTDETFRAQCIARGLERARRYTWERCIDATVAVYERAMRD